MRILVIGGTSFIGLAAVTRLHDMGHELTVFHRGETEPPGLPSRTSTAIGNTSRISPAISSASRPTSSWICALCPSTTPTP
jgi:nucleoside-diphosphate-sugar epimerase